MFGSVGLLPALGAVSAGISSGGTSALGLTMMSGLLNTMIRPKESLPAFGGLMQPSPFGPFGNLQGGPNVTTAGQFSAYIGQPYASGGAALPSTSQAGQYFGNAAYNFGSHGVDYSAGWAPPGDFRAGMSNLSFGGDLGSYQQSFASMNTLFPEAGNASSYNTFGSVMAPFGQSFAPMLTPYSAGYPQTFNPATSLAAYQNGNTLLPNQTPPPGYFTKPAASDGVSLASAIVGDSGGSAEAAAE